MAYETDEFPVGFDFRAAAGESDDLTVTIPGKAADEFAGGSIGQAAMFWSRGGENRDLALKGVHPDERPMVKHWADAERRTVGFGYTLTFTGPRWMVETLLTSMEAGEIACEQSLDSAGARACRIAAERIKAVLG